MGRGFGFARVRVIIGALAICASGTGCSGAAQDHLGDTEAALSRRTNLSAEFSVEIDGPNLEIFQMALISADGESAFLVDPIQAPSSLPHARSSSGQPFGRNAVSTFSM